MSGENYPPLKCFHKWLGNDLNQSFKNDEWCKKNKLCVYYGTVDMSTNYTISAPREWVEKNCPELLTDEEYTYYTVTYRYNGNNECEGKREEHKKKYSDFVYSQEQIDEGECDRIGDMPFPEYKEENFGSRYYETNWWDDDEDSDEDNDN